MIFFCVVLLNNSAQMTTTPEELLCTVASATVQTHMRKHMHEIV